MRSSKDDILDGQCLREVGEVFVLAVTRCRLSTVKDFPNSGSALWLLRHRGSVLGMCETQALCCTTFPVGVAFRI